MAIVKSFEHWRHYVEGSQFPIEVLSDHCNLQSFMKQVKLSGRQARWVLTLMLYDFIIKHRPGKTNPADGPSRRPDYVGKESSNTELLPALQSKFDQSIAMQESGQRPLRVEYTRATWGHERGKRPSQANTARVHTEEDNIWSQNNPFRLLGPRTEGVGCEQHLTRAAVNLIAADEDPLKNYVFSPLLRLIKECQKGDKELQQRITKDKSLGRKYWSQSKENLVLFKDRIYVLNEIALKHELLRLYYDDPLTGHFGIDYTTELLRRKFHWNYIKRDITEYVRSCGVCQGTIAKRHKPYSKLESLLIPLGLL